MGWACPEAIISLTYSSSLLGRSLLRPLLAGSPRASRGHLPQHRSPGTSPPSQGHGDGIVGCRHGNAGRHVITPCGHRNESPEVSMIRRTLTGGLLATVAMLALVPTAADAAPAAPAARPAAAVAEQHLLPSPLPAPARHVRHWRHVNHRVTHYRSSHPVGRVT